MKNIGKILMNKKIFYLKIITKLHGIFIFILYILLLFYIPKYIMNPLSLVGPILGIVIFIAFLIGMFFLSKKVGLVA